MTDKQIHRVNGKEMLVAPWGGFNTPYREDDAGHPIGPRHLDEPMPVVPDYVDFELED